MLLTQKQQRALFRKLALAALAVERHLDGEFVADQPFEQLDRALAAIANTTFRKRFTMLVPPDPWSRAVSAKDFCAGEDDDES